MSSADFSDWARALDGLQGSLREKLARSMAVAGGKLLRDEAKALAPVESGRLKSSIYLAYRERASTEAQVVYSVSWNAKTAPHGHLIEFGHWQPYKVVRKPDGTFATDKSQPRASPKWIAAKPFLRPAEAAWPRAREAMIRRGRERLPELLAAPGT